MRWPVIADRGGDPFFASGHGPERLGVSAQWLGAPWGPVLRDGIQAYGLLDLLRCIMELRNLEHQLSLL